MNIAITILPSGKYVGVSEELFRGKLHYRATVYLTGQKPLRKLFKDSLSAARWYNEQVIKLGLNKPVNLI